MKKKTSVAAHLSLASFIGLVSQSSWAGQGSAAPSLDFTVHYLSKIITPEGVTREAQYSETVIRRPGHVWVARVLPRGAELAENGQPQKMHASFPAEAEHAHFNHVLIPRHIVQSKEKTSIEFIDRTNQLRISVPASEYGNVNFDGSWENSFYLIDPVLLQQMRATGSWGKCLAGQWYEREKNGIFQKICWDAQRQIPLIVESGDRAGTFFNRVVVQAAEHLQAKLPWANLKGLASREYADYLD